MDPALGRFMTIDPMADFYSGQSPYAVAENNPILYVDAHGFGILNVLGNLWRRLKRGVRNITCGSCDPSREVSLGKSWRDPDFGWYKSHKGSSTKYGNSKRPRGGAKSVRATPAGLVSLGGGSIESPDLPIIVPPAATPPPRKPIEPPKPSAEDLANINITAEIPFHLSTSEIDKKTVTKTTREQLKKLVKTLRDYPHIKVAIDGNYGSTEKDLSGINLSSLRDYKIGPIKTQIPAGTIINKRIRAIIELLIKVGVNPKQLEVGNGTISNKGPVVNFRIQNE